MCVCVCVFVCLCVCVFVCVCVCVCVCLPKSSKIHGKCHPNRSKIDQKTIKIEAWGHLGRLWVARSPSKSIKMAPWGRWGGILGDFGAPGRSQDALGHQQCNSKVDLSAFGMFRSGPLEGRVANGGLRFCRSFFESFWHHFWKNSRGNIENQPRIGKIHFK